MGVKRKTQELYDEIVRTKGAKYINNMFNPVKIYRSYAIIYCAGKGNVFECIVDIDDLKNVSIGTAWIAETARPKYIRITNGKHYIYDYIVKRKDGFVIDHINRNTLDNRKDNLRVVKQGINMINKGTYKNSKMSKNIIPVNDYSMISFQRKFIDHKLAEMARDEVMKILNKYTELDMVNRK